MANVSLVLLAMVKNPLEILEQCVSQGRVGNLSVDKHFSVARSKDEGMLGFVPRYSIHYLSPFHIPPTARAIRFIDPLRESLVEASPSLFPVNQLQSTIKV